MEWFEAMLGGLCGERVVKVGEDNPLKDLRSRAEEGDGAVGAAGVGRFARFE